MIESYWWWARAKQYTPKQLKKMVKKMKKSYKVWEKLMIKNKNIQEKDSLEADILLEKELGDLDI